MAFMPGTLPAVVVLAPGVLTTTPETDIGGYDVMIGGHGFRLATDPQNQYVRGSEPTTAHRYDSSLEPGEQSLSPLPWRKSQSSFHAGAGQKNAEQGFTAFQYQAEQIEHIRYDTSLGVDPWTPGEVKRLPDSYFYALASPTPRSLVTAMVGGVDYAILGGINELNQISWPSGPDAAPTITAIDLTDPTYGGASNCTIASLATDGTNYYGIIQLATDGSKPGVRTYVISGVVGSTASPTPLYECPDVSGVVGWSKERLIGCIGTSLYELPTKGVAAHSALPTTANYTHPNNSWTFNSVSESPDGVIAAGTAGGQSSILKFTLDSSGGTPVLTGGASIATFPPGETVQNIQNYLGTYLAIGTSRGIRIGTFSSSTLQYGPLTIETTAPVLDLAGRDRFIFGSYTDQQEDGKTGLFRVDLSMVVDAGGRMAWAPDLRPPTSATTGMGEVACVGLLPLSDRLIYITPEGIHVEGNGPGSDGDAYLITSRIRYNTAELKLFTLGRIHGSLDVANIQVTGIAPFAAAVNLGTFGFLPDGNPGQFRLPAGLNEWIKLKFDLQGSACVLNSYIVKALPAPERQHIITFTMNCFREEVDRYGLAVTDPETPRQRYQNLEDLEAVGGEIRLVEFTNQGPVSRLVQIDQLEFRSSSRPNIQDDFGGVITIRLRATED